MSDPWEKAYVYGINYGNRTAHIMGDTRYALCQGWLFLTRLNHTPKPYPV